MSEVHARLLWVAENVYVGASTAFNNGSFYRAEIMALGAVGMTTFLRDDKDTSSELRDRATILKKTCFELASQARAAWVDKRSKPSMSGDGASRVAASFRRELESAGDEMDKIALQAMAELDI